MNNLDWFGERTPCGSVVVLRWWILDHVESWRWRNKVMMTEHWRDRSVIHPGVTLAVRFLGWIRNWRVVRQVRGKNLRRVGHCWIRLRLLMSIESQWTCRVIPHDLDLLNRFSWTVVDRSARNLRRSWLLTLTRSRFLGKSVEIWRCHVGKPL